MYTYIHTYRECVRGETSAGATDVTVGAHLSGYFGFFGWAQIHSSHALRGGVTVPETFRCCSGSQSTLSFSCCADGLTSRGLSTAAWRRGRSTHARGGGGRRSWSWSAFDVWNWPRTGYNCAFNTRFKLEYFFFLASITLWKGRPRP